MLVKSHQDPSIAFPSGQSVQSFEAERRAAAYIDRLGPGTVVLMDSTLGYALSVFGQDRERLAVTADRDFEGLVQNPRGRVTHVLVPSPDCEAGRSCLQRSDRLVQTYPDLWERGAPWAALEAEFGGHFAWRLYRILPPEASAVVSAQVATEPTAEVMAAAPLEPSMPAIPRFAPEPIPPAEPPIARATTEQWQRAHPAGCSPRQRRVGGGGRGPAGAVEVEPGRLGHDGAGGRDRRQAEPGAAHSGWGGRPLAAGPVVDDQCRPGVRPKRTRIVALHTAPPDGVTVLDVLGPVTPRTFAPARG